ncbi:Nucleoside-diphosphate kinase [Forsythia ovata]|uniref:nucleoside-diphosphate kinase n=1 Tax=Forsythia ovata TaxID=205694 RepID=A0ABD1T788_9LAMI
MDLEALQLAYEIPTLVSLQAAHFHKQADNPPEGYVAFYGRRCNRDFDCPFTLSSVKSSETSTSPLSRLLQMVERHRLRHMLLEMELTVISIKPNGVQRGLILEIISRFERKGYKLVAIKILVPSKDFSEKHYHDLKERPFFNGLCDFLSFGPVISMVW